ncbi:ribonuclease E [Aquisalimonas asiatica]|uniref:Ribonuclease E n=1 Tax=Aquisalimonas asiatica TaxID=406100 RepID=A0A1H8QEN2_9GAMM|nr:ribonuclease E [Aquisalimonas asiatica]SEO52662.1 RNAse E [Aquisalimonas asiatica]
MKRMLINATQPEELRVAMVDGQKLYDLDIETPAREQKKSNIYKGKITRVEPSLEAAFVQYGSERHGFLPFKEIARSYYQGDGGNGNGRTSIKDVIKEGQEVVVQVDKEERGTKGAALTTYVSLAGRYLVLMPNNPRAGGVSRRIEGDDRDEIRDALRQLETPEGMGLIVRTAGVGRNIEELQWDLNYLLQLWEMIKGAADERPAPFLIYQESNVIIRALRDYLRADTGEILIDDADVYATAQDFVKQVMPQFSARLKHYDDSVPLFTRYQIESQIESAFDRQVQLPSGGAIVIDHTEALISIDINSARATKGSDIEETALNTNLEAADEIARQLRIRDLGGLIVIDFIDMGPNRNQRDVEQRLREAVKMDRARVQVGRISRFGLLEMSRQRLRTSLGETSQEVCQRCNGQGTVRGVESLSLSILRLVEEEAMKEKTAKVLAQLPVDVATYLLNEKRDTLGMIESRHGVQVILVPNRSLETPHYSVERIRGDDRSADDISYRLASEPKDSGYQFSTAEKRRSEEPAVRAIAPTAPPAPVAPEPEPRPAAPAQQPAQPASGSGLSGFFRWLGSVFGGEQSSTDEPQARQTEDTAGAAEKPAKPGGGGQQRKSGEQKSQGGNRGGNRNRRGRSSSQQAGDGERSGSKATGAGKGNGAPKPEASGKSGGATTTKESGSAEQEQKHEQGQPAQQSDQGGDDQQRAGRSRRGRRGGRRRRRSSATQQDGEGNAQQTTGEASAEDTSGGAASGDDAAPTRKESAQSGTQDAPDAKPSTQADDGQASSPATDSDGESTSDENGGEKPRGNRRRGGRGRRRGRGGDNQTDASSTPSGNVATGDDTQATGSDADEPKADADERQSRDRQAKRDPRQRDGRPRIPAGAQAAASSTPADADTAETAGSDGDNTDQRADTAAPATPEPGSGTPEEAQQPATPSEPKPEPEPTAPDGATAPEVSGEESGPTADSGGDAPAAAPEQAGDHAVSTPDAEPTPGSDETSRPGSAPEPQAAPDNSAENTVPQQDAEQDATDAGETEQPGTSRSSTKADDDVPATVTNEDETRPGEPTAAEDPDANRRGE